jgi:hypothetical protein
MVARLLLQAAEFLRTSIENYQETQLTRNTQNYQEIHNYQETHKIILTQTQLLRNIIIKNHTQLSRNTRNYQETHKIL